MDVLEAVKGRRSVREFSGEEVSEDAVNAILEAGRWAPSGLNNQPWKFKVLRDKEKDSIAQYTKYAHIVKNARACIAVFLDEGESYSRTKDLQAVGACVQNMLLAVHALGLGGVWLGEIISRHEEVEKALKTREGCELMAVIALGEPKDRKQKSDRKKVEELVLR